MNKSIKMLLSIFILNSINSQYENFQRHQIRQIPQLQQQMKIPNSIKHQIRPEHEIYIKHLNRKNQNIPQQQNIPSQYIRKVPVQSQSQLLDNFSFEDLSRNQTQQRKPRNSEQMVQIPKRTYDMLLKTNESYEKEINYLYQELKVLGDELNRRDMEDQKKFRKVEGNHVMKLIEQIKQNQRDNGRNDIDDRENYYPTSSQSQRGVSRRNDSMRVPSQNSVRDISNIQQQQQKEVPAHLQQLTRDMLSKMKQRQQTRDIPPQMQQPRGMDRFSQRDMPVNMQQEQSSKLPAHMQQRGMDRSSQTIPIHLLKKNDMKNTRGSDMEMPVHMQRGQRGDMQDKREMNVYNQQMRMQDQRDMPSMQRGQRGSEMLPMQRGIDRPSSMPRDPKSRGGMDMPAHMQRGQRGSEMPAHMERGQRGMDMSPSMQRGQRGSEMPAHMQRGQRGMDMPPSMQRGQRGMDMPAHMQRGQRGQGGMDMPAHMQRGQRGMDMPPSMQRGQRGMDMPPSMQRGQRGGDRSSLERGQLGMEMPEMPRDPTGPRGSFSGSLSDQTDMPKLKPSFEKSDFSGRLTRQTPLETESEPKPEVEEAVEIDDSNGNTEELSGELS